MKRYILEQGPVARRALLLILVVGVPLLFMRNLLDAINVPKLGLLLMIVPLVAAIRVIELLQGADRSGLKRVALPAAAIAVPLTISWIFSPYKAWALFGNYSRFGGLISYLVVVAFGVLLADAFAGRALTLARALVGAGTIAAAYALLQFVGLDPFEWVLRGEIANRLTVSSFGNTNFAGGVFGIMVPLAVGLAAVERERRTLAIGAAAVIFLGLLVTVSQGGLAAAAAGGAVTGGFILLPRWPKARLVGALVASVVALATVGAVLFTIVGPKPGPLPLTVESRGEWWVIAAKMTADSPLVGRGPDVYALEGTLHRSREEAAGVGGFDFTDQPHNVALWFFACAGALGGAGFLVAVGWGLKRGLELGDDQVLAGAFFGAVAAYFVQYLVSIDTVALRTVF
ncbi:MAG: hypothetical protein QOH26_1105, partial [Actinomycetota bacterium]|nr:hypothetical protein [Actinomycetota bacterium]